jgi:hypothetical protein
MKLLTSFLLLLAPLSAQTYYEAPLTLQVVLTAQNLTIANSNAATTATTYTASSYRAGNKDFLSYLASVSGADALQAASIAGWSFKLVTTAEEPSNFAVHLVRAAQGTNPAIRFDVSSYLSYDPIFTLLTGKLAPTKGVYKGTVTRTVLANTRFKFYDTYSSLTGRVTYSGALLPGLEDPEDSTGEQYIPSPVTLSFLGYNTRVSESDNSPLYPKITMVLTSSKFTPVSSDIIEETEPFDTGQGTYSPLPE